MKDKICCCFGFTEEDIIKNMRDHDGTSTILERIVTETKKGACNCIAAHPLGR